MYVTLITGRVVDIPTSLYFSLDDDELYYELQELAANNVGSDPDIWNNSILTHPESIKDKKIEEDLDEEVKDLLDLNFDEKLKDLDLPDYTD